MKVILLKDVKKLGKKDQTVEVSDGYANNYLFPNKLAVQVSKTSTQILANQKENERQLFEKNQAEASQIADKLKIELFKGVEGVITVHIGEEKK